MLKLILAFVIGAAVVVVVVPYVQALNAPPPPARTGTPALAPAVQSQLTSMDKALADAKQSGKAVPVTLTFKEQDLTASAAGFFPQALAGATFGDPVIRLQQGRLTLTASAAASIIKTEAVIVGTPLVTAGKADVRIDSATVAGLPLPDAVKENLAVQLRTVLASGLQPRFVVESVTATAGVLTVKGTANP